MIKTSRQEMKITEEDSLCFLPNISNPAILFVFITAVREVWYQGLRDSHVGMVTSLSLNTCQNSFITVYLFYGLSFRPLRSKRILGDPGAATILVKSLETLPQCWFGYYSGLSASKYAWLNIGEGEGTLQWEQKCQE